MYTMHRVFCASSWELEEQRSIFYDLIGEFNQASAMQHGLLYVPVSLVNIPDKRPHQFTIDENIRACRHYLLTLCDDWGPPPRNFKRDYALALRCSQDPALPMREVAFLAEKPLPGSALNCDLPAPAAEFSTLDEFKQQSRQLLEQWLETARSEAAHA